MPYQRRRAELCDPGVGRGRGVGVHREHGVGVGVACGAQYLPPVLNKLIPSYPPHMIISVPVQTALCDSRPLGASVVLVGVQALAAGLYLPPVFGCLNNRSKPLQTIISVPVQIVL